VYALVVKNKNKTHVICNLKKKSETHVIFNEVYIYLIKNNKIMKVKLK